MNKEERLLYQKEWENEQREKKERLNRMKADYAELSYRDKLLFRTWKNDT